MRFFSQLILLGVCLSATPAYSGNSINNACLSSDRDAANRALCACLQSVADKSLSPAEQRRGAQLFGKPHLSEELRASARDSDRVFWQKWQSFGDRAQKTCG
ncbi:MAG: hypothetical protein P8X50_17455 [Maritimibacter sp.]